MSPAARLQKFRQMQLKAINTVTASIYDTNPNNTSETRFSDPGTKDNYKGKGFILRKASSHSKGELTPCDILELESPTRDCIHICWVD